MTDEDVNQTDDKQTEPTAPPAIDAQEFETMKAENERLKAFHDKVMDEKKQADAKAKAAIDNAAKEKAEAEGDFKRLLEIKDEEYKASLKERDDKLTAYENERRQAQIDAAALKIASELTKNSANAGKKAETLANILKGRLKLTEDGIKVTDGKDTIVSDKMDTLIEYAKKEYDFLCDGLQSTGGAGTQAVNPTGNAKGQPTTALERLMQANGG